MAKIIAFPKRPKDDEDDFEAVDEDDFAEILDGIRYEEAIAELEAEAEAKWARINAAVEHEDQLWRRLCRNRDAKARDELVEIHREWAEELASKVLLPDSGAGDRDDAVGIAMIALLEAIDRYDPRRIAAFRTYAYQRIRGAVLNQALKLGLATRKVLDARRRINETKGFLRRLHGREPESAEVVRELDITLSEYYQLEQDGVLPQEIPLDLLEFEGDDRDPEYEWHMSYRPGRVRVLGALYGQVMNANRILVSVSPVDPDWRLYWEQVRRVLRNAIAALPERAQHVLDALYWERHPITKDRPPKGVKVTMELVAQWLGVSKATISRDHAGALDTLRAQLEPLRDELLS